MINATWALPVVGDFLWCHFPELPDTSPGPKPRPALTVKVTLRADGASISVAYGTSRSLDRLRSGEFAIRKADHPTAYALAGLSYNTKFHLKRIVELPWTADFFKVPPRAGHGQTPKLGTLHPSMMRAARAAYEAATAR